MEQELACPALVFFREAVKVNKNLLQTLRPRVAEEIASLGYEMIDAEYVREGGAAYLRFYIYRPEGIFVDDCETVSRHLSPLLDEWDPQDTAYYLEVCSPDLNRPLVTARDLERNIGETVEITLYRKIDGKKKYTATLLAFTEDELVLSDGEKKERLARKEIAQIKPAILF